MAAIPIELVPDDEFLAIEQAMSLATSVIRRSSPAATVQIPSGLPPANDKGLKRHREHGDAEEHVIVPQNLFSPTSGKEAVYQLTQEQLQRIERNKAAALERKKKKQNKMWQCTGCKESSDFELKGHYNGCCGQCVDCCDCYVPAYHPNGRDRWGRKTYGTCRECFKERQYNHCCEHCDGCDECCKCCCTKCGNEVHELEEHYERCDECKGCQKCCEHNLGQMWCRECESATSGDDYAWRCGECSGCHDCCECSDEGSEEDEEESENELEEE
eukprot:129719-Rhodomonas_salina.1